MKKILITGGLGFIGSKIIDKLNKKKYSITIIDNKSSNVISEHENYKTINLDLSDPQILEKNFNENYDIILHLAGQSSGPASIEDPVKDIRLNVLMTVNTILLSKKLNIKKYIFASTFAVYGDNDHEFLSEESVCNPKSVYAVSKKACEDYIKILCKEYNINYFILRMFNVYGEGQDINRDNQGMVKIFLKQVKESNVINVQGSTRRFRDLIHVDDVVNAWKVVIENNNIFNKTFNVGTGKKTTIKELINSLGKSYNKEKHLIINEVEHTKGDILGCVANINEISKIGFTPEISLNDGIQKFKKWLDNNYNA
jgi:UDP-glucose 4-epimerase